MSRRRNPDRGLYRRRSITLALFCAPLVAQAAWVTREDCRVTAAPVTPRVPKLVLIIDDLGLRSLKHDEPLDLYEIIRARYEQGSMLITSNRAVDEWPALFEDALMASAAMNRLLHDATVLLFEGESFRNPSKKTRAAKRTRQPSA